MCCGVDPGRQTGNHGQALSYELPGERRGEPQRRIGGMPGSDDADTVVRVAELSSGEKYGGT